MNIESIKQHAETDSFSEAIYAAATAQTDRPVIEVIKELAGKFCLESDHGENDMYWVMDDDENTVIEIDEHGNVFMTNVDTHHLNNYDHLALPAGGINYSAAL